MARLGAKRARQRHALLLAARQLAGIMVEARGQPDRVQLGSRRGRRRRGAGQLQRHRDVFQRRHGRDQMEGLEDDADMVPRKRASRPRRARGDPARRPDRTGVRPLQSGHHHQQGRLAGARRTEQADRLAAAYMRPISRRIWTGRRRGRATGRRRSSAMARRRKEAPKCRSCSSTRPRPSLSVACPFIWVAPCAGPNRVGCGSVLPRSPRQQRRAAGADAPVKIVALGEFARRPDTACPTRMVSCRACRRR